MQYRLMISTDTATLCLFDLTRLAHRKDDTADWWSLPWDELAEVNAGNVLFLNLGADGGYNVELTTEAPVQGFVVEIAIPSGRFFIGAGEDATGGDLEPDAAWGGAFVDVPPGNYRCGLSRAGDTVRIVLQTGGEGRNTLQDLIRLDP